jgi:hypothetical protein
MLIHGLRWRSPQRLRTASGKANEGVFYRQALRCVKLHDRFDEMAGEWHANTVALEQAETGSSCRGVLLSRLHGSFRPFPSSFSHTQENWPAIERSVGKQKPRSNLRINANGKIEVI